ncbi:hypothetical protein BDR03DRAFT_987380 [Suillus americanus]|nr:hypothetical protein BDR03DRAFT_987380 [Suillus americanus]
MASGNTAGNATTSGMRPASIIPLMNSICSFSIPTVKAECIMDNTVQAVTFSPPEDIDIIDRKSGKTFRTCRVPVMENRKLRGYIPLPMRYREAWLELSYYIVMHTNVWRLWVEEEEKMKRKSQKEKAAILRQNTGALVAQHMLARLLTVLELVGSLCGTSMPGPERVHTLDEWKIRMSRDWFNITYEEVSRADIAFLNADPIRPENRDFFEMDWNIDEEGKGLLSLPEDLAEWFDGNIAGLNEMFRTTLKPQALAALKAEDCYYQTQYKKNAKLPARWHEGQQPSPYFWSVKHWNWVAKGNDLLVKPIDFLFYVLNEGPQYTVIEEFIQDLSALLNIVATAEPDWDDIHNIANQLWLGEMTWREFVDALMRTHLRLRNVVSATSEQKDPKNVFDTFEARLVLEGYVRRHNLNPQTPWNLKDNVLLSTLSRVTEKKYTMAWSWIISEIASGKNVAEVLKAAGPWWRRAKSARNKEKQQERQAPVNNPAGGAHDPGSSNQQAERDGQTDGTSEGAGMHNPAMRVGAAGAEPTPEEELASDQFSDYLEHLSLDRYAAEMTEHLSAEHAVSIKDYIEAIKALGPSPPEDGLDKLFEKFLHRIVAIEARKEAGRTGNVLL